MSHCNCRLVSLRGCLQDCKKHSSPAQRLISNKVSTILWISAGVNAINFFASFIGLYLVDRVGRRLLTLVSYAGILVSLLLLAIGFTLSEKNSPIVSPENIISNNTVCQHFTTCSSCTWDYDYIPNTDQEPFNCGFCFKNTADGIEDSSCVPWIREKESNEMIPEFISDCDTK